MIRQAISPRLAIRIRLNIRTDANRLRKPTSHHTQSTGALPARGVGFILLPHHFRGVAFQADGELCKDRLLTGRSETTIFLATQRAQTARLEHDGRIVMALAIGDTAP